MEYSWESLQAKLDQLLAEEPALDADKIKRIARLSVRLIPGAKNPTSYSLGESRIAGVPDVPADFQWPYFEVQKGDTDRFGDPLPLGQELPLNLIAQLDLANLPDLDPSIPLTGWLYFFYDVKGQPWGKDPHEKDRFRVIYVDCPRDDLHLAEVPDGFDEDYLPKVHWSIVPEVEWTLPGEYVGFDEYPSERFDSYGRLANKLIRPNRYRSRFLGHAELLQSPLDDLRDPFGEEEEGADVPDEEIDALLQGLLRGDVEVENPYPLRSKALEEDILPWRLLLQVDSSPTDGVFNWGSEGRIYFLIRKQDLIARRFDRVWLNLQTT